MQQVRLVGEGVNDIVSAVEAWNRAEAQGLNLVIVSNEDAIPPVVKIEDFKKLMFEKKKAKAAQKTQTKKRKSELKEVQFKANISDHDLQTKINSIDKFLERGDKVKVTVRLKGRERDNPQRAYDLIDKVSSLIKTQCKITKMKGPIAMALFETGSPTAK
jgi:translation initiation factor IF-3